MERRADLGVRDEAQLAHAVAGVGPPLGVVPRGSSVVDEVRHHERQGVPAAIAASEESREEPIGRKQREEASERGKQAKHARQTKQAKGENEAHINMDSTQSK